MAPVQTGRSTASATSNPPTTIDARMPGSTNGIGTPNMPSAPPASMTPTKAAGQAQIALPPLSAAHSPTVNITVTWSTPDNGCPKPAAKEEVAPAPTWAWAGNIADNSRTAENAVFFTDNGIMDWPFI